MLRVIYSLYKLKFSELMAVYIDGNRSNGRERYPYDSDEIQLRKAETDFYDYLNEVFFRQKDSFYAVWEENDHYTAALRIEPYMDGYLLCALETAPESRRAGCATALIRQTQNYLSKLGDDVIYSHISKHNAASLAVHRKCGFQTVKDYAVYSDGSVLQSHITMEYKYKASEI